MFVIYFHSFQDAGSKLLEKMADSFLKNDQANAGAESLEQASISIMGPLSNLMAATTDQSDEYLDQQKSKTFFVFL